MAGTGSRFGNNIPKQYLPSSSVIRLDACSHEKVNKKQSLFSVTVSALLDYFSFSYVVFVLAKQPQIQSLFMPSFRFLQNTYPHIKLNYTTGGNNRHQSFIQGFLLLKQLYKTSEFNLMIHDANRPYLSLTFIEKIQQHILLLSKKTPCWIPIIPNIDSLYYIDDAHTHYLPREAIYSVQTPQLLHAPSVEQALQKKDVSKILHMQDDWKDEGAFMQDMGFCVSTFPGDINNKKITYPGDWPILPS